MNYQAICAAIETPLNTAFAGLTPPVKIYFDNIQVVPPDPPSEYVRVNITFGMTTESTIAQSMERARGAVVVRIYTRMNIGGLRARQLAAIVGDVFNTLGSTKKASTGLFLRVSDVSGPTRLTSDDSPHYGVRMEASWQARQSC